MADEAIPPGEAPPWTPKEAPHASSAPAGYKQMTEQFETDMRNAAAWKPMRWGMKMQIVGVFAQLLGIVLAGFCFYYVLNFGIIGTGRGNAALSVLGLIACITFFIGSILAVIGTVILPVSLLGLARIPGGAKVGRWAPWGLWSLPVSIGIVATVGAVLVRTGFAMGSLTGPWLILSVVAASLLFFGLFCVSHILGATASFWHAAALGRQFPICLTTLCGLIVCTVAILLAGIGIFPSEALRLTTRSWLQRTWPMFAIVPPVAYLLLMSWHLVLMYWLLARIPIATTEPLVPK